MWPPLVRTAFRAQGRSLGRRWPSTDALVAAAEGRALRHRPDLWPVARERAAYLLGNETGGRARLDRRRLVEDATDALTGEPTLPAVRNLNFPVHLIAARHGAHDQAKPLLSDAALTRAATQVPRLTSERVDANHITLLADPALALAA
ncbi:hypothetical protein [Paractinoplanes durhamensis]